MADTIDELMKSSLIGFGKLLESFRFRFAIPAMEPGLKLQNWLGISNGSNWETFPRPVQPRVRLDLIKAKHEVTMA